MNEKKEYRQTKREIKRIGNRNVRNQLKRKFRDHPEEAHWDDYDFNYFSTKEMNGKFLDYKRYNDDVGYPEEEQDRY